MAISPRPSVADTESDWDAIEEEYRRRYPDGLPPTQPYWDTEEAWLQDPAPSPDDDFVGPFDFSADGLFSRTPPL